MTQEAAMNTMIKVSAAEFQRNIGRYQDLALTQPVAVTRNGRERTVMISTDEYSAVICVQFPPAPRTKSMRAVAE